MPDDTPAIGVDPFGRPSPAVRDATLNFVDAVGTHLVCPLAGCRRARRCADPDPEQLPFCFWQHRGPLRFLLLAAGAVHGVQPNGSNGAWRDETLDASRTGRRRVRREDSLLGRLAAKGAPIGDLMRPPEAEADEWAWEDSPWARAVMHSLKARSGAVPAEPSVRASRLASLAPQHEEGGGARPPHPEEPGRPAQPAGGPRRTQDRHASGTAAGPRCRTL
jgi:hypothetical protein